MKKRSLKKLLQIGFGKNEKSAITVQSKNLVFAVKPVPTRSFLGGKRLENKEAIDKIAGLLDSVIVNFDQHLRVDHGQDNHGYLGKDAGKEATLRFYLENILRQLRETRKSLGE